MGGRRRGLLLALAALAAPLPAAETPADPLEGFETLRGALQRQGGRKQLARLLPGVVAPTDNDPWVHVDVNVLRQVLVQEISTAVVRRVDELAGEAVVRFSPPGGAVEKELFISRTAKEWVVTSGRAFPVSGPALARARGPHPARFRLAARPERDGYGASGYSFTHATGDPAACANRVEVWYCARAELHATRQNRLALLPETSLAQVRGLRPGLAWEESVRPRAGQVLLVHLRTRQDFYVVLQVLAAIPGHFEADWTLLTDGWNAPRSIHEPQRLPMPVADEPCAPACAAGS